MFLRFTNLFALTYCGKRLPVLYYHHELSNGAKHNQKVIKMQAAMIDFIVKSGGAELLKRELAEMAIQDQFTGLENRLARDLRAAEEKPIKVETVPSKHDDDELSGDYYNDRALFFKDGSVEIVSYKGEGGAHFSSVEEYDEYVNDLMNPEPEYDYFFNEDDEGWN